MSEQMSFVYVALTGHVLSVITSVGKAATPLTPQDLASSTLSVRFVPDENDHFENKARFYLAPEELGVFMADKIDAALFEPRSYYFDADKKKVQTLPMTSIVKVTSIASSGITVDLGVSAVADTNVLVAYAGSDPSKSEIATGKVTIGTQTTNVPATPLPSGSYILTLAEGYLPRIHAVP